MVDFFNKITDGIDKSIKAVSSKSKEFIETTKLNSEIRDVRREIDIKFQLVGKNVFEMFNKNIFNEEKIKLDCLKIRDLFKKITELEDAIKIVEGEALKQRYGPDTVMCTKCGAYNRNINKFCVGCGTPIVVEPAVESKTCPVCGTNIDDNAIFCVKCGRPLKNEM